MSHLYHNSDPVTLLYQDEEDLDMPPTTMNLSDNQKDTLAGGDVNLSSHDRVKEPSPYDAVGGQGSLMGTKLRGPESDHDDCQSEGIINTNTNRSCAKNKDLTILCVNNADNANSSNSLIPVPTASVTSRPSINRRVSVAAPAAAAPPNPTARRQSLAVFTRRASRNRSSHDVFHGPTYRMEPREGEKFDYLMARNIMDHTMSKDLNKYVYNINTCADKACQLSEKILQKVKVSHHRMSPTSRYKFVCHVTLIQLRGQSVQVSDRCLWDVHTDNQATCTVRLKNFVCVATLYGIYME